MNEILESLKNRRSVRVFTDEPVSAETKKTVLCAAMEAPTAGNQQLYTILDITEQCETHRALLRLPAYVFPAAMLVLGYPTKQQKDRPKPKRASLSHIVHENAYRRMEEPELRAMFEAQAAAEGQRDRGTSCLKRNSPHSAAENTIRTFPGR